jgi:hypothetical protein
MLLESSWGYILFRPVDVYKVERNYMDIERYIEDFKRFFKFVASYTFASPDEALRYLTADNHGTFLIISFIDERKYIK